MKKISWLMFAVIVIPLILTACGGEKEVEVTRVVVEKAGSSEALKPLASDLEALLPRMDQVECRFPATDR